MTTLAIPTEAELPDRGRKGLLLVGVIGVILIAAVAAWFGRSYFGQSSGPSMADFKFHTVTPSEMQVKVHKDGELQALNNIEIVSNVESTATIVQIVKEGASVNAGDVLVELDSSGIRQRIEDTTLELQRAESDVAAARNAVQIQKSQNDANLEASQVEVQLAKLAIQQYTDGTYPLDLETAQTNLKMEKIRLANKEDDFKQIKELYAKTFVNLAEVKAAELDLETVRNAVNSAAGALEVLSKYTHPMMLAEKQSILKQAEQKLARTMIENQNNLTKATTALETQETAKKILERRLARTQEQFEFCTIKAPQSGLVVYNNGSSRDSQPIQEGSSVRERQVILRLPDTSAMKAVVRINESQVIRLSPQMRAIVRVTGIREPIGASISRISPVSDSSSRYFSPDTREYPVELTLDWTPPNLKPGIGVNVEILVQSIPNALSVPLASLYSVGNETYVFTKTPDGNNVEPQKVKIGVANETHVLIAEGVQQGAEVLMLQAGQGRELLEKAGIRPKIEDEPPVRQMEKRDEGEDRGSGGGSSAGESSGEPKKTGPTREGGPRRGKSRPSEDGGGSSDGPSTEKAQGGAEEKSADKAEVAGKPKAGSSAPGKVDDASAEVSGKPAAE